jgi:surface protein
MKMKIKLSIISLILGCVFYSCSKDIKGTIENSEAVIKSFTIEGCDVEVGDDTIIIEHDYYEEMNSVSPEIVVSYEAEVSPESNQEVDLSKELKYIVTAQDGKTKEYKVELRKKNRLARHETRNTIILNSKYVDKYKSGETIEFEGVSYLIVDKTSLKQMITDKKWSELPKVVTSLVTDMSSLFYNEDENSNVNADISSWDVSNVTNMEMMFRDATKFNQDISKWDVSKVTNMKEMFRNAEGFMGRIGTWDVSNVTDMESMFHDATKFNSNISKWNVINVINMDEMFHKADNFSCNLSDWDVGKVASHNKMFNGSKMENKTNYHPNFK